MNIIGGKLKGKKLIGFKTKSIRPAMALVRKSVFDILRNDVINADVLDLCAGSGSMGIEALSRGAKSLTLVDSSIEAINIIKKNLSVCNLEAQIIKGVLPRALKQCTKKNKQFNLIFLDPPYGKDLFIESVLENIVFKNILSKDGLILIETEKNCEFTLPVNLQLVRVKEYGNTKISILGQSEV